MSQFGEQITLVALPLTAVLLLHANAFEMGVLGAMRTLPFVLVGLFVGVFVDRHRRRPMLIGADVGRALLLALVPALAAVGALTLVRLAAIALVVGALTVLFDVAYQSYLPALVGREALVDGNGKLETSRALSSVAGPSVGGVLVGALTAPIAVAANALTYVVSVASLLLIRAREPEPAPKGARARPGPLIREGLVWVLGQPLLRAIAGCTGTSNLFGNIGLSVFVLFAVRQVGLTPALLGLVYAAGSAGGVVGALVAAPLGRRLGLGTTVLVAALTFSAAYLLVPAVPDRVGVALPVLVFAFALQSSGSTVYNITQVSLRQAITPDGLLGRMNASMRFVVWGTMPFGSFVGGILGASLGLRPTLWIAAAGGLLSVAWVLFSPLARTPSIAAALRATAGAEGATV